MSEDEKLGGDNFLFPGPGMGATAAGKGLYKECPQGEGVRGV